MKYSIIVFFLFSLFVFSGCGLDESLESSGSLDRDDTNILEEVGPQFLDQARDMMEEQEHSQ